MDVRTCMTLAEPTDLQKNISKQTNKQTKPERLWPRIPPWGGWGWDGWGMGAKARSPQFPSIVVVREKDGHTRWPAEKRHRPQRSRDCRHYSLSHREKPLCRGKPMGLSRVLPEAKGYPSLEHSGSQPGQGRRSSSKVSPVLGRGSVPGVPGVPLATPRRKRPQRWGQRKSWVRGRFPVPPPPRTPPSSLVPARGSRTRFSRGLLPVAELRGPRQPRPRRGQPHVPTLLRT